MRSTVQARYLLTALATIAVAASATTVQAAAADTFEGSCEFAGTVKFDPPLSTSPRDTQATADAEGPCTGTWTTKNGKKHALDGARVVYHAESDGQPSCASSDAEGSGFLRYRDHKLRFRFQELRVGAATRIRLEGRDGGAFEAAVTGTGDTDLSEIIAACAADGLRKVGVEITGTTVPTISG